MHLPVEVLPLHHLLSWVETVKQTFNLISGIWFLHRV